MDNEYEKDYGYPDCEKSQGQNVQKVSNYPKSALAYYLKTLKPEKLEDIYLENRSDLWSYTGASGINYEVDLLYKNPKIQSYFIKNELDMNFYLKSDSYSAALSIIKEGIGISILDDNTCARADNNLLNISDILDTEFKYDVSAIIKKDIGSNQCNDFFNFLTEQI